MSFESDIGLLQDFAGVDRDLKFGPKTAAALVEKLGLRQPAPAPMPPLPPQHIRVCIDPGHGLGNRTPGVYDPGCQTDGLSEATIVLEWARELDRALTLRGIPSFWTRRNDSDPCPIGTRARRASDAGCSHLISIHVNDAEDISANGCETLYRDDSALAEKVQAALVSGLGIRDRGAKQRTDLAVLKFSGQAVLIEVGFINSQRDQSAFLNPLRVRDACEKIAAVIFSTP